MACVVSSSKLHAVCCSDMSYVLGTVHSISATLTVFTLRDHDMHRCHLQIRSPVWMLCRLRLAPIAVLLSQVCVPDWPFYNRHPLTWQPAVQIVTSQADLNAEAAAPAAGVNSPNDAAAETEMAAVSPNAAAPTTTSSKKKNKAK